MHALNCEAAIMVLAHLGERVRPVKFCGGIDSLQTAIRNTFRDVLAESEAELLLQVCHITEHAASKLHVTSYLGHCRLNQLPVPGLVNM